MSREVPWSEQAAHLLVALYHSGAPYADIAAATGHTQHQVEERIRLVGLRRKPGVATDIAKCSLRFAADGQRLLGAGKLG